MQEIDKSEGTQKVADIVQKDSDGCVKPEEKFKPEKWNFFAINRCFIVNEILFVAALRYDMKKDLLKVQSKKRYDFKK